MKKKRKGKATRVVMYPARMDLKMTEEQHKWIIEESDKVSITHNQYIRDLIDLDMR
jgi:hypothetical protein